MCSPFFLFHGCYAVAMWEPPLAVALLLYSYSATPLPETANNVSRYEQASGTAESERRAPAPDLHAAVRAGDVDEVSRLLDAGADPNSLDALGGTALLTACWLGQRPVVSMLLAHGANVNAIHREAGASALQYAVLKGRADIVELLLKGGADVSIQYRGGQTVLHLAAARPSVPVLDQLITAKADLTAKDDLGKTPLDEAV